MVKTVIPEEARPKLKQVGKIDLDNLNKKTAPKVEMCIRDRGESTQPDYGYELSDRCIITKSSNAVARDVYKRQLL